MRTFELWIEGYDYPAMKARKIADIEGPDFPQAIDKYVEELPTKQAMCWEYCDDDHVWKWCGRRATDNEKSARAIYG